MLTYFISQSNGYTIRTEDISSPSNDFTMSLTDMMGLNTTTADLSYVSFTEYENILSFTASIDNTKVGKEYRTTIYSGGDIVWNGSLQVFASQSEDKAVYETKNTQYVSHTSDNQYIIYE